MYDTRLRGCNEFRHASSDDCKTMPFSGLATNLLLYGVLSQLCNDLELTLFFDSAKLACCHFLFTQSSSCNVLQGISLLFVEALGWLQLSVRFSRIEMAEFFLLASGVITVFKVRLLEIFYIACVVIGSHSLQLS